MRRLDRYVLFSWIRIFLLTAVGLPIVSVLIQLTDNINRLLDREITTGAIAVSYLFALPENIATMMPAACLFATVFTIGPLTRYSEITAAKASGVSFHRISVPLILASAVAAVLSFYTSEIAPEFTQRQFELQKERVARSSVARYNFVYRAQSGWVYSVRLLNTQEGRMEQVVLERVVRGGVLPDVAVTADSARWDQATGRWVLRDGATHFLPVGGGEPTTLAFRTLHLGDLAEAPEELLLEPRKPEEMTYGELRRYIGSLGRSGSDTEKLEVERALKLALPAACLIITLFGAPLAVSSPRAGAAVGIAISLGTTLAYLLLINFTKAIGASGVLDPVVAAWIPNGLFLGLGTWLMVKVRT